MGLHGISNFRSAFRKPIHHVALLANLLKPGVSFQMPVGQGGEGGTIRTAREHGHAWQTYNAARRLVSEHGVNVNDHASTRLIDDCKSVHITACASLRERRQPLLNLVWKRLHLLLPTRW